MITGVMAGKWEKRANVCLDRNEYYNSKPGRMAEAAEAEGADMNSGPVRG